MGVASLLRPEMPKQNSGEEEWEEEKNLVGLVLKGLIFSFLWDVWVPNVLQKRESYTFKDFWNPNVLQ